MRAHYIPRPDWGARKPRRAHYEKAHTSYDLQNPVKCVIFGYTMTTPCYELEHCKRCVFEIQERNMDKYQLVDIRYNFLIDPLGNRFICRGWKTIPSLPQKYRDYQNISLYIGFIGFFNAESPPSQEMFDAKEHLLILGVRNGHVSPKFMELNI